MTGYSGTNPVIRGLVLNPPIFWGRIEGLKFWLITCKHWCNELWWLSKASIWIKSTGFKDPLLLKALGGCCLERAWMLHYLYHFISLCMLSSACWSILFNIYLKDMLYGKKEVLSTLFSWLPWAISANDSQRERDHGKSHFYPNWTEVVDHLGTCCFLYLKRSLSCGPKPLGCASYCHL